MSEPESISNGRRDFLQTLIAAPVLATALVEAAQTGQVARDVFVKHAYEEHTVDLEYDLVGVEDDFQTWTVPARERISAAKREEILGRLESWAASRRTRVSFGPGQTVDEHIAQMRVAGWRPEVLPDGQVGYRPPKHSLIARLRGLWRVCRNVLDV